MKPAFLFGTALTLCAPAFAAPPRPLPSPNAKPSNAPRTLIPTPQRRTLPNGLTILVLENRSAPVVAVRAYVRTGSIYEGQLLGAGLSHLFEHTLFNGTSTRTKAQINDELQAIGGQSNAYTTYDVTAYYLATATPYFERGVNLLADMLQNATLAEAEVKAEQGVIRNEMNLGEDNPEQVVSELWNATAFRVHPARNPIIGYREAFDRITRDDILNYYRDRYAPQNTVLSVAGDVSAQQVFDVATRALGKWPRRTGMLPTLPQEPPQISPRRAAVERDVSQTYLQVGWHTIPLQSPDLYALDVLASVLGGGDSSRLVRELRDRRNLVSQIAAYSSTPNYDAGSFNISAQLTPKNLPIVEAAVAKEVARLRQSPPTLAEVRRAQRQIQASFTFNNADVENQAEQMALDEISTGDPTYSRSYVERIQRVTPQQVQAVALKYLTPQGLTTAVVRPRGSQRPSVAASQSAVRASQTQAFRLSNGLRVLVKPNRATPTVAIVLTGLGGARLEPRGKAGLANLTAQLLTRDTRKKSAQQVAEIVDELGGDFSASSGYNSWTLSSQWLSNDWKRGLNLLAQGALQPTFLNAEVSRQKSQILAQLGEQNQEPLQRAALLARRTFFGANSAYGRSALGVPGDVRKLTRQDAFDHWRRALQPRSSVLAIYGDVKAEDARRFAEAAFGKWGNSGEALSLPPISSAPFSPLTSLQSKQEAVAGATQTGLFYAFPGIDARSPDRYALDVLDAALSGAGLPGGRLFSQLRDAQVVYDANAFSQSGLGAGAFLVYAGTTRENAARAGAIIETELRKARDADLTPEELERAKSMCIAARALENQTNGAQASSDAANELLGLGANEDARYAQAINAVTLADVRRVAGTYLALDRAAFAVAGPPSPTPAS